MENLEKSLKWFPGLEKSQHVLEKSRPFVITICSFTASLKKLIYFFKERSSKYKQAYALTLAATLKQYINVLFILFHVYTRDFTKCLVMEISFLSPGHALVNMHELWILGYTKQTEFECLNGGRL